MKDKIFKLIKGFGFIYFSLNIVLLFVISILAIQAKIKIRQKINIPKTEAKKLFEALYVDDVANVKRQLEKVTDLNSKNETGRTPLQITQNKAILIMLISKNADVNAVDENNMSPIFRKDIDLSKILVEAGADINLRSNKGAIHR